MQIKLQPLPKPINKTITLPGSKSYTNRALMMAALANGRSIINNYSPSNDSDLLIAALQKIGVKVKKNQSTIKIHGTGGKFKFHKLTIDMQDAGTSTRFFTALAGLIPGEITLTGSKRMQQRPILELTEALKSLGVNIQYLNQKGYLPIKIKSGEIKQNQVSMKGDFSSQYFSALMMIAPVLPQGLTINVQGKQVSKSYIDMTIGAMKDFGITVQNNDYQSYQVSANQSYQSTDYQVEIDASGASYFWAIAALTQSTIRINQTSLQSAQADMKFAKILHQMGCEITINQSENWIQVTGPKKLQAIPEIDMELMPDTAQTLAVVASFASGQTKITGLSTLKIKETDRLEATKTELTRMGIKAETGDNYLIVHGGQPHGATINTYKDHRMAMSFAVAGSRITNQIIDNPSVVAKSLPDFWQRLTKLGIKQQEIKS